MQVRMLFSLGMTGIPLPCPASWNPCIKPYMNAKVSKVNSTAENPITACKFWLGADLAMGINHTAGSSLHPQHRLPRQICICRFSLLNLPDSFRTSFDFMDGSDPRTSLSTKAVPELLRLNLVSFVTLGLTSRNFKYYVHFMFDLHLGANICHVKVPLRRKRII